MSTPPKSCLDCPSLIPADDASFFRKSIGVPVCARYGNPLGRINSPQSEVQALARHFAESCADHGRARPAAPDWSKIRFQVTLPDPATLGVPKQAPELVNSCAGCKFFVREDIVVQELGWAAGMCSAKGRLLLANRYTLEARNCDDKDFGQVRTDTTGLTYLPEYEGGFGVGAEAVAAHVNSGPFVDPAEYETDRPVDEKDAHKIRAWRRIADPVSGNEVFLPIFRRDYFKPEIQDLIPSTGDDEHPEDYVDHGFYVYKVAVLWMELDETPAFWGKAGTGKTEFFRHMAYLMQAPFYRFSITGSTELDDLAGKMHYTEGVGTHFEKGRLVKAWESACVMVVDEPNAGPPDVWQFLRPMTDNSKQLVLDQSNGERSTRDLDCYLGMAMNPAWDILNVGTQPIGDADANRLMHLYVELPPETLEKEIITKRCSHDGWDIPAATLNMVMAIAKDVRALTDTGTLPISWAIRPQIKVSRALRWFDPLTAYKMASADYLEPQQQQILLDVVKTHIEGEIF